MLSNLLLEHYCSNAYAKPAVFISGLGWSIFFDIADAVDTSDVSTDSIHVMRSVPASPRDSENGYHRRSE